MEITIKKHRRNLSYDAAATLSEFWVIAKQFDRSFYRELKVHWDEHGYDEYIVAAQGRLPYCESPEQYVCRMETRREILAVLALCTEKQRKRLLPHADYKEVMKMRREDIILETPLERLLEAYADHCRKNGSASMRLRCQRYFAKFLSGGRDNHRKNFSARFKKNWQIFLRCGKRPCVRKPTPVIAES